MKITYKNATRKFQMGGEIAPESAAPESEATATPQEGAPAGGQEDPLMMLAEMSAQALQNQDCQLAMQVCQAFVEITSQAGGQAPQGEPVFAKNGGKLLRRI